MASGASTVYDFGNVSDVVVVVVCSVAAASAPGPAAGMVVGFAALAVDSAPGCFFGKWSRLAL